MTRGKKRLVVQKKKKMKVILPQKDKKKRLLLLHDVLIPEKEYLKRKKVQIQMIFPK
jgi:hypothetical protein